MLLNKCFRKMRKSSLPAVAVGAVRFPFDMEGASFATGALKVKPTYQERENIYVYITPTQARAETNEAASKEMK